MAGEADELLDVPETANPEIVPISSELIGTSETTEYDNPVEDILEIDPEEEQEPEDRDTAIRRAEMEEQFARYELNYRARRIRDLTRTAVRKPRHSGGKPAVWHRE